MRSHSSATTLHVVLHHQHRAALRHLARSARITGPMSSWPRPAIGSSSRIMRGLQRDGGGQLERALAAVRQLAGGVAQRQGSRPDPSASSSSPRASRRPQHCGRCARSEWCPPVLRCSATRTFSSTLMWPNTAEIWNERTRPHARHRGRVATRDVAPVERITRPLVGRQEGGEQVEAGGLAGAVRPDQGMDGMAPHAQGHVLDRHEPLEGLGQPLRLGGCSPPGPCPDPPYFPALTKRTASLRERPVGLLRWDRRTDLVVVELALRFGRALPR